MRDIYKNIPAMNGRRNLDMWIEKNYETLSLTTRRIIKDDNVFDDFFHFILEEIIKKNDKMESLTDEHKLYYFIRLVKNNYFSKTSPYHYKIRRHTQYREEYNELYDEIPDEEYENTPDMIWVKEQLETMDWFSRDLFLAWLELGTMTEVSKKTHIPINSVGRYINKIKQKLIQNWNEKKEEN